MMSVTNSFRLGIAALAFTLSGVAYSQLNLHVSPTGNDSWSGMLSAPNGNGTDGPKKTLVGGRDALRSIRAGQSPGGVVSASEVTNAKRAFQGRGAVINVANGTYDATTSLILDTRDGGGSTKTPVIWKATTAGSVILDGGKKVNGLAKPATTFWNTETRVAPAVRPLVYVADISSIGGMGNFQFRFSGWNATWADISFRQIGNYNHAAELIIDDAPMTLSQWPNAGAVDMNGQNGFPRWHNGYNFVTGIGPANDYSNPNSSLWTYELKADFTGMKTPSTITSADDIWMRGGMSQSRFRETWEHVTSLNFTNGQANGLLRFDPVTPYYQNIGSRRLDFTEPGRFTIVNSIYELDAPGEYYIDRQAQRLYLIPPTTFVPGSSTVKLTMNQAPLVQATGVRYASFDGFVLQNGRFMGAYFKNCNTFAFKNGKVRNVGHNGITIDDSYRTNVQSCVITDTGEGAIDVQSGDRNTLTVSGNLIADNVIRRYGRLLRFYTGAVRLDGCGNTMLNNTVTDGMGEAVVLRGNEQLVQGNSFARVDYDAGDSGVVVTNHNVADHGNVVKGNTFKEINQLPYGVWPNSALFVDGAGSGVSFEGNVIDGMSHPVNILPACDITIKNNVFLNCDLSAIVAGPGPFSLQGSSYVTLANQFPWSGTAWKAKYPHLYEWLSTGVAAPLYYTFSNNVFYNVNVPVANMPLLTQQLFGKGGLYEYNVKFTSDPFVNKSGGDYSLTTTAKTQVPNWVSVNTTTTGSRTLSSDPAITP